MANRYIKISNNQELFKVTFHENENECGFYYTPNQIEAIEYGVQWLNGIPIEKMDRKGSVQVIPLEFKCKQAENC